MALLSSHNRIIWQYFQCLRRLINRIETIQDEEEKKQDIALCIFMAVTTVEAFFNIYFRILIDEDPFSKNRERILSDLERKKSLDYKIKNWPKMVFNKKLNLSDGYPSNFLNLKDLRNRLVHFVSSYETVTIPGISIQGLADTAALDNLELKDAISSHEIAAGMLKEIFILRGMSDNQIRGAIHLWTGCII